MADRFLFLGGHPAVDLVNTRPVLEGRPVELLATPRDLVAWLRSSGQISSTEARRLGTALRDPAGHEVLDRAIAYRETIRRGLQAVVDGGAVPPWMVASTNRLMRALPIRLVLETDAQGITLRTRAQIEEPEQALGVLARSVAELLATGELAVVRRCANPECVLFFLDPTRSRTRRWCSMATCGNRAKQRRFQRKHREADETTASPG